MEHVSEFAHRRIWYHLWDGPEHFAPPFAPRPYTCMVVASLAGLPRRRLLEVCRSLIATDCRSVVAFGPEAERWHDWLDWVYLESDPEVSDEHFVMSSGFDDEPLGEAMFHFLMCADFEGLRFQEFVILFANPDETLRGEILESLQTLRFLD